MLHPKLLCEVSFPFHQSKRVWGAKDYNGNTVEPSALPSIAEKLKFYRITNHLRQIDVARAAEVDESTYISYEKGERDDYPADKLGKIAALYGLALNDLLDDYNRFLHAGTAAQIKALRRRLRLTQKQLAEAINVSPAMVKAWEQKGIRPSKENWRRLAELGQLSSINGDLVK